MTHEELEQATDVALNKWIGGIDDNDIREVDQDNEISERVLELSQEVVDLVLERSETMDILVTWAEYVLECHHQGFEEAFGGITDFGLYLQLVKEEE